MFLFSCLMLPLNSMQYCTSTIMYHALEQYSSPDCICFCQHERTSMLTRTIPQAASRTFLINRKVAYYMTVLLRSNPSVSIQPHNVFLTALSTFIKLQYIASVCVTAVMNDWTVFVCTFVGLVFVNAVDCYILQLQSDDNICGPAVAPCRLMDDLTLGLFAHVDGERLI